MYMANYSQNFPYTLRKNFVSISPSGDHFLNFNTQSDRFELNRLSPQGVQTLPENLTQRDIKDPWAATNTSKDQISYIAHLKNQRELVIRQMATNPENPSKFNSKVISSLELSSPFDLVSLSRDGQLLAVGSPSAIKLWARVGETFSEVIEISIQAKAKLKWLKISDDLLSIVFQDETGAVGIVYVDDKRPKP